MKTNAIRKLEQAGISFDLRHYEVDESDLSAESVAAKIGLPSPQVYKTLLVRGDRTGLLFALVAAGEELDLGALARVTGDKRCELVPLREVQPLTGYVRGGVTAIAAKKDLPVFVDEIAQIFDVISVSAGARGTQVIIAPTDYARVTRAKFGQFARPLAHGRARPF